MDPFRMSLAVAPLALYGLMLGVMNVSRRPCLISGTRDFAALAIALMGLVIIGPMELLLPDAAANQLGSYGYVWLLMLAFYALSVLFLALIARPKLVVYNISLQELRETLEQLAAELDEEHSWAGDNLVLPNLGVQLHLDNFPPLRNVTLCSSGDRQSYLGWRTLEQELAERLHSVQVPANPWGVSLIAISLLAGVACLIHSWGNQEALAQGIKELLRL